MCFTRYPTAKFPLFLTIAAFATGTAQAGVGLSGALITDAQANQLETWLGAGDMDFTAIWTGTAGVSTAASFHAAADGQGATFSVFDVTLGDGTSALFGGYTAVDWGSANGYHHTDSTAFLFNLTTGETQFTQEDPASAVFTHVDYFPTFGNGSDLQAGEGILGTAYGSTLYDDYTGYSYSFAYDTSQGQIAIAGDFGAGDGSSGYSYDAWSINTLEVYTFAPAAILPPVPVPAGLPLLAGGLGLFGFISRRRRKT